ncbi:5468_t:CDS:2 [Rhizophagus irregularis]|nr:5468_t:CDS:2 [Rhizophagus irregularis]
MPRKTKRQLQVSQISRKRGRYISKDQAETEIEAVEERKESEIGRNWIEDENINDWTNEEFEKVGKRHIAEVLCWQENATKELALDTKGIRTLDTLFTSTEISTSMPSPQSLQLQFSPPSPFLFSETQNRSLITEELTRNLQIRLKEINQQCSITKSAKTNKNVFTYDYLRRLISIRRYIQLLLDGQGKMDASNQIAQTMWVKGDYIARCIRKWGAHFIQIEELLIYHQGKHTKLESLLNDEDFKEECLTWLRQQKPESHTLET